MFGPEQPAPAIVHCTDRIRAACHRGGELLLCPKLSVTLDGETETDTDVSGTIAITAEADFAEAAAEVAVTVTFAGLGSTAGAV